MAQGIGPNTNAPSEIISDDCVLLVGEDALSSEPLLLRHFGEKQEEHVFRGYVFQRRPSITSIFCGMGGAAVEPLLWEMSRCGRARRLILAGTAGAMPACRVSAGRAYVISSARAAGSGLDSAGLTGDYHPRWEIGSGIPTASTVSTDFYYGFSAKVLAHDHPLHGTRLPELFSAAREDLVDMEVASFYCLCERLMSAGVQYVALKSPVNPAGYGADHLANTPAALHLCLQLAAGLLRASSFTV